MLQGFSISLKRMKVGFFRYRKSLIYSFMLRLNLDASYELLKEKYAKLLSCHKRASADIIADEVF